MLLKKLYLWSLFVQFGLHSVILNYNYLCIIQCLKLGLFTWPAISLEKQKNLSIKARGPKISYGFGGHCNFCMLSGLCLFCNSYRMEPSFTDVFDELSFSTKSCVPSSYHQTNSHHVGVLNLPNQISSKWILNLGQDWREMQICD